MLQLVPMETYRAVTVTGRATRGYRRLNGTNRASAGRVIRNVFGVMLMRWMVDGAIRAEAGELEASAGNAVSLVGERTMSRACTRLTHRANGIPTPSACLTPLPPHQVGSFHISHRSKGRRCRLSSRLASEASDRLTAVLLRTTAQRWFWNILCAQKCAMTVLFLHDLVLAFSKS